MSDHGKHPEDGHSGRGGNLADLVRAAAQTRGDRPALRYLPVEASGPVTIVSTTWAELDREVDAAATGMVATLSLTIGDRVALVLSNSAAFVTAYFAVLRAGLVAVPVNPGYTAPELAHLLGSADAKVVLCDDASTGVVEEAVSGTSRVLVDPAGFDAIVAGGRSSSAGSQPVAVSGGEDLAVLLFTSGTSGQPRGAMLTHRALLANIEQCRSLDPAPMLADDVVLVVLPLFHVYGLNAVLGMVAATGATALLCERFDPEVTLDLIRTESVTNVPGAPPMYLAWAAAGSTALEALRGVRMLASGASPLPPALLDQVYAGSGRLIHEGYGLTEAAPVVASTIASARVKPGSIGQAVPGVEVRLLDEGGAPVTDGDPGEIWVRGDNLFSGYWPDGAEGPDAQGWWATGDVAYADEDGDLFLVDRRKELVLVNGFNVYPREVEVALGEHPDVLEVAVISIPDEITGEAVKAFVVARPGSALRPEQVMAHAETRLARFKRPSSVVLVDTLPRSATGKVAKGRLREHEAGEVLG